MIAQSETQRDRCIELYITARLALEALAEERLNLGREAREALDRCRGELETMDAARVAQPVSRKGGAL